METKTCKDCGRTLPLSDFKISRTGKPSEVCRECVNEKTRQTRAKSTLGNRGGDYHDPDFDGKDPGEVIRLMGRAQRWLESRGFQITLKGEYNIKKQIKFQ